MKIIVYVFLVIALFLFIWLVLLDSNPLKKVSKYRVYYGEQFENMSEAYGFYDAMILETHYYTKKDLEKLHDKTSTIYIGYLTVFEIPNWDIEFVQKVLPENFLKVNNLEVFNEEYNNYVGDIRQESYRKLLIETLEDTIVNKGFDGVFLDTVDWIDYFVADEEEISRELLEGYFLFLKEIEAKYPNLIIIQNRSFWSYENGAANYIDGVMWENYTYSKASDEERYKTLLLLQHQFLSHQKVFVLSHEGTEKEEKLAKWLHWNYFNNTLGSYRQWE